MSLTPTGEHRANITTSFSMLLSVALVIVAIWLNIRWIMCLWMFLGGLAIHCGTSRISLAIAKFILRRQTWAIIFIEFLSFLVPVGIALYMAGLLALAIKALKAGLLLVF